MGGGRGDRKVGGDVRTRVEILCFVQELKRITAVQPVSSGYVL